MADFLNLEDVLTLHADQVALYGGDHGYAIWACSNRPSPNLRRRSAASFSTRISLRWPRRTCSTLSRTTRFWTATNGRAPLPRWSFSTSTASRSTAPKGSVYEVTMSVATGQAGKAEVVAFFRSHAR